MGIVSELRHLVRGSCFTKTLADALGKTEDDILYYKNGVLEMTFNAYYSQSFLRSLLNEMGLDFHLVKPVDFEEWCSAAQQALTDGYHVLVCYDADHGKMSLNHDPHMKSGHYAEILSISGDTFTGRQSNVDGERRGELKNKRLEDLYASSLQTNKIRVNYGKLNKCPVRVSKHTAETEPRCGSGVCLISGNQRCMYQCDMGGVLILVKEK